MKTNVKQPIAGPASDAKIELIPIGRIVVGARLRRVSPQKVAALRRSIKLIGLQTPLLIQRRMGTGMFKKRPVIYLVAGAHRLEAARQSGLTCVPCLQVPPGNLHKVMGEFAENFVRAELTALERAEYLQAAAAAVSGAKAPAARRRAGRPVGRLRRASAKIYGPDASDAQLKALQRARQIASLAPKAKAEARRVGVDKNQRALLLASKERGADAQLRRIKAFAAGKNTANTRQEPAVPNNVGPTSGQIVEKLRSLSAQLRKGWIAAPSEARRKFASHLPISAPSAEGKLRIVIKARLAKSSPPKKSKANEWL